jgi:5'-nucleotidase
MQARLLLCLAFGSLAFSSASAQPFTFTILHTNDLHSHMEGSGPDAYFTPSAGDGDPVRGHFARLATAIASIRSEKTADGEPLLLVDAGDFYSGTLFHALGPDNGNSHTPELEFFSALGYDAVTLGNHEFDAGESGLATMMSKAARQGVLPRLVATNLRVAPGSPLANFQLTDHLVKELHAGGRTLRVGIIGLLGPDAALVSASLRRDAHFVGFDDAAMQKRESEWHELARSKARELRAVDKADVVIAIVHAGAPEDEELARAVPEIDVVIAGHTHQTYQRQVDAAVIAQAGCYGETLGRLELSWDAGRVELRRPAEVVPIDDRLPADAGWLARIAAYREAIDVVLAPDRLRYAMPVTTIGRALPRTREPLSPLGTEVSSKLRANLERRIGQPVAVYFTSLALVRSGFELVNGRATEYRVSDVFRMMPIGFDSEGRIGSPILSFFLTKSDLWKLIEFTEIYRHISANFTGAFSSSLTFRIRDWGLPFFNRIGDLRLDGRDYADWPELIRVGTSAYVANYLSKIDALSYGLISITPRDAEGRPLDLARASSGTREFVALSEELARPPH